MKKYFCVMCFFLCFYLGFEHFYSPLKIAEPQTLIVYQGDTRWRVVRRLVSQKLVSCDWLFLGVWRLYAPRMPLKSGAFLFHPPIRRIDVLKALVSGKMRPHFVMIPEGLTSFQIVQRLKEDPFLEGDVTVPDEGSMLPDTYAVPYGESRQRLIERMQKAMAELIEHLWEQYGESVALENPYQAIILASILEKETSRVGEHRRIAGIFYHRLRKKMRLQSCPTVIYGLSDGWGLWKSPLTKNDLKHSSPYNTYIIQGLPPTPICHPGRQALEAVFKPMKTQELYFVSDGKGGHLFGHTFDHHQRNRHIARQKVVEK